MAAPAQPKKIVAPTVSQINAEFVTQVRRARRVLGAGCSVPRAGLVVAGGRGPRLGLRPGGPRMLGCASTIRGGPPVPGWWARG
jgi:hypothetical protein